MNYEREGNKKTGFGCLNELGCFGKLAVDQRDCLNDPGGEGSRGAEVSRFEHLRGNVIFSLFQNGISASRRESISP